MNISLSSAAPNLSIWSHEMGLAVSSRVSLLILQTQSESGLTYYGILSDFRGGVHFFTQPTTIVLVPSLSGHTIAYRWRSLLRVHRPRASSPYVVLATGAAFAGITMGLLMRVSFFPHPHLGICETYRIGGVFLSLGSNYLCATQVLLIIHAVRWF